MDGLRNGRSKSCGKCKNNLTGKVFGRLTVLNENGVDKFGHKKYRCQCECGNIINVLGDNLKRGKTKSCGCLHSEITSSKTIDLTGKTFGKLTVLKKISEIGVTPMIWECKCECGTIVCVSGTNLKTGHTTSCGCIISKGEFKIKQLLQSLQYNFTQQYIFKDLPKRKFDFAIFKNSEIFCLIEYNGKQHYEFVPSWHKTLEDFKNSQIRDQQKIDYCNKNNILLIIIPYTDFDKINKNYLLNIFAKI